MSALVQRRARDEGEQPEPAGSLPRPNRTGLPDSLKAGVESQSGVALDDVRVHYNSPAAGRLDALAYTRGTDIHVAPGEERSLPHEAWHVVQQAEGRVAPSTPLGGVAHLNEDAGLEREADVMGERASRGAGGSVPHAPPSGAGPRAGGAAGVPVLQAKFSAEQKQEATVDLDRIEKFLASKIQAQPASTSRGGWKDIALGVTEMRENHLSASDQRDLLGWLEAAERETEADILARCRLLLARAEGRSNNTNLRIFGDKMGASTWMDWVPVDATVAGKYRTWFTECATKPLLARDGRFKFNLSGFDPAYTTRLVKSAAVISREEMDRQVDEKAISKTDWEVLEVLTHPQLFGRTDFLLFDKTKDTEPTVMDERMRAQYGVDKAIQLVSHQVFLERKEKEKREADEEEAAQERFQNDMDYRTSLLRARYEQELKRLGKKMDDPDVTEAFDEAMGEREWPWKNFEEWWGNGSKLFFQGLKSAQAAEASGK